MILVRMVITNLDRKMVIMILIKSIINVIGYRKKYNYRIRYVTKHM